MDDLGAMIQSAAQSLPSLQSFVFIICGVIGIIVVIVSLANHVNEGRRGQSQTTKTIVGVLIGSLLLSLPTVMEIWSTTLFGIEGDPKIVESAALTETNTVRRTLHAITLYINLIGWIAGARGLWEFKTGPQYQDCLLYTSDAADE